MDEVAPAWLSPCCRNTLGSVVQDVLFAATAISEVYGVRLADGQAATVKERQESAARFAVLLHRPGGWLRRSFPACSVRWPGACSAVSHGSQIGFGSGGVTST
jgi:hypothetical protein